MQGCKTAHQTANHKHLQRVSALPAFHVLRGIEAGKIPKCSGTVVDYPWMLCQCCSNFLHPFQPTAAQAAGARQEGKLTHFHTIHYNAVVIIISTWILHSPMCPTKQSLAFKL